MTSRNRDVVYEFEAGRSDWTQAMRDLANGFGRWPLWTNMAARHFRTQYRGTVIGPFWITITTTMTAAGLGLLYSQLFGLAVDEHLPYVAIALTVWGLISSYATAGAEVFNANRHIFQEYPIPLSIFPLKLLTIQVISLLFRLLVVAGVLLIFRIPITPASFLAIPGLIILVWIGFWVGIVFGILNAAFRDFGELLSALLTFMFFVTPIFWRPDRLGDFQFVVDWNPFYHFIELVRAPLLHEGGWGVHFAVGGGIAVFATIAGLIAFGRFSRRLPYWC